MPWQFSLLVLPLLITVCGASLLCIIAWRHREYQYARSLTVLMFAVTLWAAAYVIGISTADFELKRLVYGFAYLPIGVVSITWLTFAIQYTGRLRAPTNGELTGLAVVPSLTAVAALTNRYHGLVWSSVTEMSLAQIQVLNSTHGALFWVHTLQAYALIGLGSALIVAMAVSTGDTYRSQSVSLLFAAGFPVVVNVLFFTGVTGPLDLTPAAFSVSGAVLIGAVFRNQLLQSLPLARELARDELIDQMEIAVIVVDKRDRIVDFNPAAESLVESTDATVIGSHVDVVFPDITDAAGTRDGAYEHAELTKRVGGTERHYEVEVIPLRRPYGVATGQLLTVHDVTDQRRSERELDRERDFINQALDTLNDIFYVVGADGTFRRWNDRLPEVTGYDAEKIDGMDVVQLFGEDGRERIPEAVTKAIDVGHTKLEARLLTADGERIPYEFTGTRLTDPDGELIGLVGIGRDISQRKERERELRTYKQAVESAGHAIYWTDDAGTIEYVNSAFEKQTAYDAPDVIGETPAMLDSEVRSEQPWQEAWDTVQQGDMWEGECVNRRKTGQRYMIDQSISPVYDDGEIARYVAVSTDITERYHREQQLSVLQRVLRHDLRNNLNEILLSTQMLRRELDEDEPTGRLDAIEQTVDETLSLGKRIQRLRESIEKSEQNYSSEIDIVARAQAQVAAIRTERQGVEFTVDLPSETSVVTSELIDQAIRNVIQNAIEHTDAETPRIAVTLERQQSGQEVALCIADHGPGIPRSEIETLESEQEGQLQHLDGFGLWFVNWVVRLAGGGLEFADNEPRGTIVRLVLPAVD